MELAVDDSVATYDAGVTVHADYDSAAAVVAPTGRNRHCAVVAVISALTA